MRRISILGVFIDIWIISGSLEIIASRKVVLSVWGVYDFNRIDGYKAILFGLFLLFVGIYILYTEMNEYWDDLIHFFNNFRKYNWILVYWLIFLMYPVMDFLFWDLPNLIYVILLLGHLIVTILFVKEFNKYLYEK